MSVDLTNTAPPPVELDSPVAAGELVLTFSDPQVLTLDLKRALKGDPGDGGSSSFYQFVQSTPAAVWDVTHNLGKFPSVTVVDSAGSHVEGDIQHLDINTVRLSFVGGFSGTAYLN